MQHARFFVIIVLLAVWGGFPAVAQQAPTAEPVNLPTPFTAEQIRDEWIPGLTLELLNKTPNGEQRQRWTVMAADTDGVDIELAVLAADGSVAGAPTVARNTWEELRDHAAFHASLAKRERTVATTALGEHAGWLYTVRDAEAGVVTEFFFADALPGAPLEMRVKGAGGVTVVEMLQVGRKRP